MKHRHTPHTIDYGVVAALDAALVAALDAAVVVLHTHTIHLLTRVTIANYIRFVATTTQH